MREGGRLIDYNLVLVAELHAGCRLLDMQPGFLLGGKPLVNAKVVAEVIVVHRVMEYLVLWLLLNKILNRVSRSQCLLRRARGHRHRLHIGASSVLLLLIWSPCCSCIILL